MSTILSEDFIEETMKGINEAIKIMQGVKFKKAEPINALLMDSIIFSGDDDKQEGGIITFENNCLAINARQSDISLLLYAHELWQIIAFALDNGLQLPQNEE